MCHHVKGGGMEIIMMVFCTLFDSYYLDKGLTLYKSLRRVTKDFKLYIFCFDKQSYDVLKSMELSGIIPILHTEIEDETLLRLKSERSKAEYCWTCTPVIIEYVLEHFREESCTYIDADLYFFKDPSILFHEITKANANIVITEHRFSDSLNDRRHLKRSGKYCVEFNYFDRSFNAQEALKWWKEKCFEWCYHIYEPERMGDQKYLEKFPILFKGVHELHHPGGGVAPWNLKQYDFLRMEGNTPILKEKRTGKEFPLVFYHFQNMRYLTEDMINVSSGTHSKKTKDAIYPVYLREIEKTRKELKKHNISFGVKKIYSSNKLIAFLQGNVLRFKVKSLTDIYDLNKLR